MNTAGFTAASALNIENRLIHWIFQAVFIPLICDSPHNLSPFVLALIDSVIDARNVPFLKIAAVKERNR
jgi:hypothetical protein